MGVIKDGTISGNFPSAEAFAVHYPGYPSSTTSAVETLGGSEGILKVGNGQSAEDSNRISKCLSEDDIHLSQKSCPESVRTDQVDECESASMTVATEVKEQLPEEVQEDLSADIVTRISEAYQFNGMVDYQHVLAVHADVARRKKRNWADMEPQFGCSSTFPVY
ncbi:transcription factor IIIC, subunit 5 [Actinidia rufa]|uniref:Transcription factor IIIC, subunit 5 n=1 Tax=Actinidia rufa TaxID=165716 RepID=A0A7J0E5M3_9ERIC|nr:transcription factor IIIC, subunit 5 [Actinidia rufa]